MPDVNVYGWLFIGIAGWIIVIVAALTWCLLAKEGAGNWDDTIRREMEE